MANHESDEHSENQNAAAQSWGPGTEVAKKAAGWGPEAESLVGGQPPRWRRKRQAGGLKR